MPCLGVDSSSHDAWDNGGFNLSRSKLFIWTKHAGDAHHVDEFDQSDKSGDVLDELLEYLLENDVLSESQFRSLHTKGGPKLSSIDNFLKIGEHDESGEGVRRRYSPLGQLAGGSMGQIYVARESDLNRKVAFKQIARKLGEHQGLVRRFVQEVQITAQLDHPTSSQFMGWRQPPRARLVTR